MPPATKEKNSKKSSKSWRPVLYSSCFIFAAVMALALAAPVWLGEAGVWLSGKVLGVFGWPSYILSAVLIWAGIRVWKAKNSFLALTDALALPLVGFFLAELTWGLLVYHQRDIAGAMAFRLGSTLLFKTGVFGSAVLTVASWMAWLWVCFDIPWLQIGRRAVSALINDWREWRRAARRHALEAEAVALNQDLKPQQQRPRPEPAARGPQPPEPLAPVPAQTSLKVQKPEKALPAAAPANGNGHHQWKLPPLTLLKPGEAGSGSWVRQELLEARGEDLVKALANFEVSVTLQGVVPGPVVTRYDLIPAPGVKVGEIANLTNDIALAMRVGGVRILGPIAGRGSIGIEVPNPTPKLVRLREVLEDPTTSQARGDLVFALGRSASGEAVLADLTDMPHLLVAGATNSGKSVLIHTVIVSLLYRMTPQELKLVLIDPKRLELPFYDGISHLFDPRKTAQEVKVITEPKEASKTIASMVDLMEARYERFSLRSARNIEAYNNAARAKGDFETEPYVVVVIDELADLMLVAGREVENNIQRLAQMARAVGIHLILATQRPSVDIITGVIKANLPARIALQVVSKMDSRVILDSQGAENLIGAGDLLYLASGAQKPVRIQGAYVSDEEISQVAAWWTKQGPPQYPHPAELLSVPSDGKEDGGPSSEEDENLRKALALIMERRRVSQDLLKAHFGSSARATDMLSRLEIGGFIHKPEGTNRWEIRYDRIEDKLNKKGQ